MTHITLFLDILFLGRLLDSYKKLFIFYFHLLRARRGARNPNLRLLLPMRCMHVCSKHSFGLPLRMYKMHRTHARLDFLSLVIWSRVFWPSVTWNVRKASRWSKSGLTFDRCRPHSVTFGCYWFIYLCIYFFYIYIMSNKIRTQVDCYLVRLMKK